MKFSEMPYSRPDAEGIKKQIAALTERLKAAKTYEEAKAVFLENEELGSHVNTLGTLVSIRHSIEPATNSTTKNRPGGTIWVPSFRNTTRPGWLPCWLARSVRSLPKNTAS